MLTVLKSSILQCKLNPELSWTLDSNGSLEPSRISYDKKVAGIISGAGGYKPGIVLDKQEEENNKSNKTRMAVALMGKDIVKLMQLYHQ